MDFLLLRSGATSWESLQPLLQVLSAIPNQRADFDESRATLQQPPSSERGETNPDLFGDFLFRQETLHVCLTQFRRSGMRSPRNTESPTYKGSEMDFWTAKRSGY